MTMRTDRLLSTVEAARRLDVDVSDVYRLIFAGELRGEPTAERVVRIRESDLAAYLDGRDDPAG